MSKYTKEVNEYLLNIQQGDRSQLEDLYHATAGHLIKVAKRYVVNKNLVKDVVSEAFIKIGMYVDSFDCSKDGYNWMCKIVQNAAMDINKKEAAISEAEAKYARMQELVVATDYLDGISFLEKANLLDETDRYILYHKFVDDQSLAAIGRSLGISRAAVCKRLQNISKKTKEYLKKGKQN